MVTDEAEEFSIELRKAVQSERQGLIAIFTKSLTGLDFGTRNDGGGRNHVAGCGALGVVQTLNYLPT